MLGLVRSGCISGLRCRSFGNFREILVNVEVRRDVVDDELDQVEGGVLRRPVQLAIVAHIPLVLCVTEVQVESLIDEADFVNQLARRWEFLLKSVW